MKKPLRMVTWLDSSTLGRGGWLDPEQIHPQPLCEICSVGWIIRSTPRELVIAGCESSGGQLSRLTAIPKRTILKMEKLGCIPRMSSKRNKKR